MADGNSVRTPYRTGYSLLWEVRRNHVEAAEEVASEMAALAEAHDLGDWEITSIGLGQGDSCWFELRLGKDVDALLLKMIFGRLPCGVY